MLLTRPRMLLGTVKPSSVSQRISPLHRKKFQTRTPRAACQTFCANPTTAIDPMPIAHPSSMKVTMSRGRDEAAQRGTRHRVGEGADDRAQGIRLSELVRRYELGQKCGFTGAEKRSGDALDCHKHDDGDDLLPRSK